MGKALAMADPVRVGLVGAGPWAKMVHAPVLAAGPETTLAGVWARRPEQAERLATRHGAPTFATVDELFANCEAVSFAVPPGVQAELAIQAAQAGKALLLEKPIADDLAAAERLAAAVDEAGVPSMVVLSWRYARAVRDFLDQARSFDALGGRAIFVSGALLGGPFATPWRLERGPLLDLGPHVLDLLDAALGPITSVKAHGDPLGWVGLLVEHKGGVVSEVSMCASSGIPGSRSGIELYGRSGSLELDCATAVGPDAFGTLRTELAAIVRDGAKHPLDIHRGLHLQRHLADAEDQLLAARS